MKKKDLFLLFILNLFFLSVYSQKSSNFIIGFEIGSNFVTGDLNPNWNIRQDIGNYNYSFGNNSSAGQEMTMSFIGIKPEISFFNNKVGISSGLRYTRMNSSLNKNSSSENAFFFLRNNGNTVNTEYFKVKNINEDNDYLGIPLEITVVPFQNDYFDLYLRVGAELNFKFNTNVNIQFLNAEMNSYQQELINNEAITPNFIYSSVYSGLGIRMGKKNEVKYNLELVLPSYILTSNNSSMIIPRYYSGFKFIVQFPLCKTDISKQDKPVHINL